MEKELIIGQQRIRFDRDTTIALYRDTITVPGADQCGCIYCRNFAAQRGSVYTQEFLSLLNEVGADPSKEWEAFDYDFGPESRNRHMYGGWFLFSGILVEGAEARPTPAPFFHWFTTSFPNGTLPKDAAICAIEFSVEIPWVLPEKPE
jgi:hypothetical protein